MDIHWLLLDGGSFLGGDGFILFSGGSWGMVVGGGIV